MNSRRRPYRSASAPNAIMPSELTQLRGQHPQCRPADGLVKLVLQELRQPRVARPVRAELEDAEHPAPHPERHEPSLPDQAQGGHRRQRLLLLRRPEPGLRQVPPGDVREQHRRGRPDEDRPPSDHRCHHEPDHGGQADANRLAGLQRRRATAAHVARRTLRQAGRVRRPIHRRRRGRSAGGR